MNILKLTRKAILDDTKNVISITEGILNDILEDITKFKNSLPADFNQVVPLAYFYGFFLYAYKQIFDSDVELEKYIKKSLKNLFGRKQGKLIFNYSTIKKDNSLYVFGLSLAEKDVERLKNYEDSTNLLIDYYKGIIKPNLG